jgi:DNA-binding MurR/RpiR family transcriptional regulator
MQENLHYIASMPFKDIVAQQQGNLSVSDRQIIQELLSDPARTAFLSAAEIGERVGVHEATVVRLAKKLGYNGYKDLRYDLRDEIAPAERVRRRLKGTTELATLVEQEIATLQALVNTIPQAAIDDAARLLIAARKVFVFGQGHASALVDYMNRRLRRSGFETIALRMQGRELAEHVLALNEQDVVLGFAFRTQPQGLAPLLNVAAHRGARSIVISDTVGVLLRPQPDILLAAARGEEDQFLTLTVPMVICNSVILTIARLDEGRSMKQLDHLSDLIRLFETEELD